MMKTKLILLLGLIAPSLMLAQAGNSPCTAFDVTFDPNPCDTINSFLLPSVTNVTTQISASLPCYSQSLTKDTWVKFTVPNYPSAGVRFKMYSNSDSLGYALYRSPTSLCSDLTLDKCSIVKRPPFTAPNGGIITDRENGRFAFYFPDITVGETYWLRLWETQPQIQGMTFKTGIVVLNDNCADAFALEGTSCNYGADGLAEPEAWTPNQLNRTCQDGNSNWGTNDNAIWYRFEVTASTPQPITVRSFNVSCYDGQPNLQMAIWTNNTPFGCDLNNQTMINCAVGLGVVQIVDVNLAIGNYFLLIDGSSGAQCGFQFESAQLLGSLVNDGPNCPNADVIIRANNVRKPTSTYLYTFSGGNITTPVSTGTTNNYTLTNPIAGTYTVTITETNASGTVSSVTATTVVTIAPVPTPTNLPVLSLRCGNGCGPIDAGNGIGTYVKWVWSNGDNTRIATACTQGVYTVTVTNGYGCSATGTTTVDSLTVMENFASENRYADCEGQNGRIQVDNVIGGAQSGFRYWLNNNSANTQYSNIFTGINAHTPYTVWAIDTLGCKSFTTVSVGRADEILLPVVLTAHTTNYADCEGHNGQIIVDNVSGGAGAINQYYLNTNTNTQYNTLFTGVDAGTQTVWVSDTLHCKASALIVVGRADQILTPPSVTMHTITADCDGKNGTIFIDGVQNGAGPPYQFIFNNQAQAANDSLIFHGLIFGEYTITLIDSLRCKDTLQANLPRLYYPEVSYTAEKPLIFVGESTALIQTVTRGQIIHLSWTDTDELNCGHCAKPIASPFQTATYIVTMTDNNHCSITRSVTVTVQSKIDIYAPNIITPNNDGNNDIFMLFAGRSFVQIKNLQIFDRWGALVFENKNYNPNSTLDGWDGTFKGKELMPATFVWRAEVLYSDGTSGIVQGDVTLVR